MIKYYPWLSLLSEGLPPGKAASNSCQGTGPPSPYFVFKSRSLSFFFDYPFLHEHKKGQEDTAGIKTGVAFLAFF